MTKTKQKLIDRTRKPHEELVYEISSLVRGYVRIEKKNTGIDRYDELMDRFYSLLDKFEEEIRNELDEFWGQAAEILKKGLEELKSHGKSRVIKIRGE